MSFSGVAAERAAAREAANGYQLPRKAGGPPAPDLLVVRGPLLCAGGSRQAHSEALGGTPVGGAQLPRRSPRPRPARTHSKPPKARRLPALPPAALQGGVSSSAHCSRPSARPAPAPPCPAAAAVGGHMGEGEGGGGAGGGEGEGRGRGRGPARTGRARSSRSRQWGRSRADAAQDAAAAAAPPLLALRPSPALRQQQGGRAGAARPGSPGPQPGRRSHPQASPSGAHSPTVRTRGPSAGPAATCSRPRGEDTMRCALALSALLLLLVSPLLASQDAPTTKNPSSTTPETTVKQGLTSASSVSTTATVQQSTVPTSKAMNTLAPTTASTRGVSSDSPGTTTQVPQTSGPVTTTVTAGCCSDNTTTANKGSRSTQGAGATTVAISTTTVKPDTTSSQNGAENTTNSGGQRSHSVTTDLSSSKAEHPTTHHPTNPVSPSQPTWTHPVATPTRSGHDHLTTASSSSSSSSTVASPGHTFTSPGMITTPQPSVISQRTEQTSSQMPASSMAPSSKGTVQPTSPTTALRMSPLPETMSSSPTAASTTHRYPKTPSPTLAHGSDWTKCEAPEMQSEKLLILNLTGNTLCAGGPPDEKLVTLMCQAVKATFNRTQDECSIRLARIQGSQAVAVKEITIHTKFPAKDVYERLKDKWDELKDAGVSHMQLGDQGPPEEAEDRFSMPLIITIVCMASFLLLVAALYGCCHQRLSQRKDQQRLTEELQTVENGYHDNPTLEVMETSSEMQEKKVVSLNGELGDSWIVPLDNLTKDDLDEEEDTHL
nr:podocalyxin isoform X2 [Macaca fascicularis]